MIENVGKLWYKDKIVFYKFHKANITVYNLIDNIMYHMFYILSYFILLIWNVQLIKTGEDTALVDCTQGDYLDKKERSVKPVLLGSI